MLLASEGFLDVISVNIWQVIISVINLFLMFLILKRFLFAPVQKMLATRQAQLDKQYDDAAQAQKEAHESKQAYEDKLAGADEEARAVVRRAMQKANAMSDDILRDTGKKVDAMMEKAKADIAQEEKRARNELKDEIAQMSLDIAQRVVGKTIDENDHRKMIDGFIAEMGEKDNA
ncbi:MAG: F0F1 ATP synthase subunit B [Clostridia bacterium]|nr:F0F1 ATP synthase subunit B [Clostridia bacterium]